MLIDFAEIWSLACNLTSQCWCRISLKSDVVCQSYGNVYRVTVFRGHGVFSLWTMFKSHFFALLVKTLINVLSSLLLHFPCCPPPQKKRSLLLLDLDLQQSSASYRNKTFYISSSIFFKELSINLVYNIIHSWLSLSTAVFHFCLLCLFRSFRYVNSMV